MSRFINGRAPSLSTLLFALIFSVVGFGLFRAETVSALWEDEVGARYVVYNKAGNFLYYNGASGTFAITNTTPQIKADPEGCDGDNSPRNISFNVSTTFKNCAGLVITGNGTWFEQAYYSFAPGDFDYEETIDVSGGIISDHGTSTASHSAQHAKAKSGDTSANCDSPNPNYAEKCSVLIVFNNGYTGNFRIEFDNETGGGRTSGHEFWYQSPIMKQYRTLTFNPSGGSVVDGAAQGEVLIWPHPLGLNALREYVINGVASGYPTPTRAGYTFAGWYTAPSGGTLVNSPRIMSSDATLYAHWNPIPTWTMSGYTTVSSSVAVPGQQITFTHHAVNSVPYATGQDIWSITEVNGGLGVAKLGHNNGPFASGQTKITDADTITIPNGTPAGTQYCQRVGYQWTAYNNSALSFGAWACVYVAALPYVSVAGGNTWAGGSAVSPYIGSAQIRGTSSVLFGSFGEYGVSATGTISLFGSAARVGNNGLGMSDGSTLTFGNTPSLGTFSGSHKIGDLTTRCATMTDTVVIPATVLGLNDHRLVCADTVRVSGNITYDSAGATAFGQLPSLTVVARTIQIDGDVTEIAGSYYAASRFVTCTEGPWSMLENAAKSSAITATGVCSKQLVVNGAITVANSDGSSNSNALVLNRGYDGDSEGNPAELVRMRPEVFLTSYENNMSSLLLTTAYETELPSRY